MAQRRNKTSDSQRRLSALGILRVAFELQERGPQYWSLVAHQMGLPLSFVNDVRRSACDVRRSEEVEFLERLNTQHVVEDIVNHMDNIGLPHVAQVIRETQESGNRDERVFSIPFEVVDTKFEFRVETIGSATLQECLKPFCDEYKLSFSNLQFLNSQPSEAQYHMSTLASQVKGKVRLKLTEFTRRSQDTQTRSRDSRASKIYNVVMVQIGPQSKIIMRNPIHPEHNSDTDDADTSSVSDSSYDTSVYNGNLPPSSQSIPKQVSPTLPRGARSSPHETPPSPLQRTPPLAPRGVPSSPRRTLPSPVRETPPLAPRGVLSSPHGTPPSPHRGTPPHGTPPRFLPPRRSSVSTQLEMSDVSDGEDQPVEYENHQAIRKNRSHNIPRWIVDEASCTKGFWHLSTDHQIQAAHRKLIERFGDKDGRFIVWPYGKKRFVATVTYQGNVRHFQIIWKDSQLSVYGREISAPNFASLLKVLKETPLQLSSVTGEVTLRSPIQRIPVELEDSEYEEPISHRRTDYMDMSGSSIQQDGPSNFIQQGVSPNHVQQNTSVRL